MSEKLSNLLDKHVAQSDLDDFLHQCREDPSLIEKWQRYHQVAALIRNEIRDTDLDFDVSEKVMAGIQAQQFDSQDPHQDDSNVVPLMPVAEQQPASAPVKPGSGVSRRWFSVALAASVLLGMYFIFQPPLPDTPSQQVAENGPATSESSLTAYHWQASSREIESALNSLLVEHSEFTSVTGMNGLGSYSKFIAYQN